MIDTEPVAQELSADLSAASAGDAELVKACLAGSEEAWGALIQKYKRLIYSIPFRYGAEASDAADVFQSVCLELFSELANVRQLESLRSWLITVTVHKCILWKKHKRPNDVELDALESEHADSLAVAPETVDLEEVERAQLVREAIGQLPARCLEMVRLLFYETPPLPYAEVARRLGLATGSIGFIRGRCLQRLHKTLASMGL